MAQPEDCSQYFRNVERARYFSTLYAAYALHLAEQNALDFPALIFKCRELFKRYPAIADRYRRTFRFTCIDKFQDTNSAQYKLIRAFTGESYRNLFVVADDDQIIYQWNGASPKRLQEFQIDYAASTMQMPTNFRCPPEVVELANRLVENNRIRSPNKQPLNAGKIQADGAERVRVLAVSSESDEAADIAADVANRGFLRLGTVAVLARTKRVLEGMRSALLERGIESRIAQRRDAFASIPYQWLHAALIIGNRRSDSNAFRSFVEASNALWGLGADDSELIAESSLGHGDLLRAWTRWVGTQLPDKLPSASDFTALFSPLAERGDFRRFCREAASIFSKNRAWLENTFASYDEYEDAWKVLYREITHAIGAEAPLEAFLQELEMRSKEPPLRDGIVPLLTIHSSKGNEFHHVYLAGLAEDILPSFQSKKGGA